MNTAGIWFTIPGKPEPKGSKRPFALRLRDGRIKAGLADTNPESMVWQNKVGIIAKQAYSGELLTGPLRLVAHFWFRRPKSHYRGGDYNKPLAKGAPLKHIHKPDLDKLVRTLKDGMSGIIWADDKQVVEYFDITKDWTDLDSRCEVRIEPMSSQDVLRIDAATGTGIPLR